LGGACFEGAGTMAITTDRTYVREGKGNYHNAGYVYAGDGAGSFAKEAIETPYGCRLRPWFFFFFADGSSSIPVLLLDRT